MEYRPSIGPCTRGSCVYMDHSLQGGYLKTLSSIAQLRLSLISATFLHLTIEAASSSGPGHPERAFRCHSSLMQNQLWFTTYVSQNQRDVENRCICTRCCRSPLTLACFVLYNPSCNPDAIPLSNNTHASRLSTPKVTPTHNASHR